MPRFCQGGISPLVPGLTHTPCQCVPGDGTDATLHGVLEELVCFRGLVRQVALGPGLTPGDGPRQQLLEACDSLRQGLATHGVCIKVSIPGNGASSKGQRWGHPCPLPSPAKPPPRPPVGPERRLHLGVPGAEGPCQELRSQGTGFRLAPVAPSLEVCIKGLWLLGAKTNSACLSCLPVPPRPRVTLSLGAIGALFLPPSKSAELLLWSVMGMKVRTRTCSTEVC